MGSGVIRFFGGLWKRVVFKVMISALYLVSGFGRLGGAGVDGMSDRCFVSGIFDGGLGEEFDRDNVKHQAVEEVEEVEERVLCIGPIEIYPSLFMAHFPSLFSN